MLKKIFSRNKDEIRGDYIQELNIVYFLREIELQLGVNKYNHLLFVGLNKNILSEIKKVIFGKYPDRIDIIKLDLKNYIRCMDSRNDFYKPSSFFPLIISLFCMAISPDNELVLMLIIIIMIFNFRILFKKQESHMYEYNERVRLANIILDIIEMHEK